MSSRGGGRPDAATIAGIWAMLEVPEGSVTYARMAELLMLASVPVPRNKVRGLYFCVGVQVRQLDVAKLDRLIAQDAEIDRSGAEAPRGGRPAERLLTVPDDHDLQRADGQDLQRVDDQDLQRWPS